MTDVLIVVAHHDDEVLGCGGFIAKTIESGNKVHLLVMVEGRGNQNIHCMNVAKFLGISSYKEFKYPKFKLDTIPLVDIIKSIQDEINKINPYAVLTHDPSDLNQEHKIVYEAVMVATRPITPPYPQEVLTFPVLSSQEYNYDKHFIGDTFVVLERKHIQIKSDALSGYKDEIQSYPHPRSGRAIEVEALYTCKKIGELYAEEFRTVRRIIK